jgi:hypothetical protein
VVFSSQPVSKVQPSLGNVDLMRETHAIRGGKVSLQPVEDLISTKLPQNEPVSSRAERPVDASSGIVYQALAILFCVLFGLAMIVNTQLSGEGEWFWYARLFHGGAKLYADLHLPLQPLFVLETNAWIQSFGTKCLVTEIPSVIHVLVFCLGIFLILRESDWPDWQKAIVLASAFLICIECTAYRFDDYHIVADTFIFYSLVLLLMLAKVDAIRRQFGLAAGLGVLSGLTITTRLNYGTALLVAAGICLLVLARKRKLVLVSLFVVAAALTVVFIVKLTGDSFSDYVSNAVIKAAGAKGGTGSILTAPFRLFRNALQMFHGRRWIFLWVVAIVVAGALIQRYWKNGIKYIIFVQLGMAGAAFALSSHYRREQLISGAFISFLGVFLIVVNYLLLPLVASRFLVSRMGDGKREWDSREILILLPLAELASASASTAATTDGFLFSQVAMLLLLIPVVQPFRKQARWANASLVTIMALLGISAMTGKIENPYSWLTFRSSPMFENRQWYRHPIYGPMYIESDLLHFIEPVCRQIGQGNSRPELLSMPFSYPNYFCDTPPWHGYVQTFFDTSTRSTIEKLMGELQTAPPQWIVYQRQMKVMEEHEGALHHGQPLAHRDLDKMIMQKIVTGQWQVEGKSNYLFVGTKEYQEGDGWLIIRTRP